MTQFVLLALPEDDDQKPRAVGPFLAEHLAHAWANAHDIPRVLRLVYPLEPVARSVYGQGRHALIPSPVPRDVAAGALAAWDEKKAAARAHPDAAGLPVPEGYELVKPTVPLRRDGGPEFVARPVRDLAAGGTPITRWAEEHADLLRRYAPPELPNQEKDQ